MVQRSLFGDGVITGRLYLSVTHDGAARALELTVGAAGAFLLP